MPIYEYSCDRCDEAFEVFVKRASERVVCPKCGAKRVKKVFSTFAAGVPASGPAGTDGASHASHGG